MVGLLVRCRLGLVRACSLLLLIFNLHCLNLHGLTALLLSRERAVWGVVESALNPEVRSRGRDGTLYNQGYETMKVSTPV